jgi:hypothetical protein
MALISKTIVFLILAIIVAAYHGYQLQPCSLSTVGSFAASRLSRLGPIRNIRLYSAIGGESISADTVVARCTKKIVDSLNPKECSVTSTDDDPNGSHVSCRKIFSAEQVYVWQSVIDIFYRFRLYALQTPSRERALYKDNAWYTKRYGMKWVVLYMLSTAL